MKKIAVIGSLSVDFVVETDQKPADGETVFGNSFQTSFGGKGANQAVAAKRLGAAVQMFGCVGNDTFGQEIIANLAEEGIDVTHVERVTHCASGSAHITLFQGDNSIIVVPSANNCFTPDQLNTPLYTQLLESDLVMLQHEIPQETNEAIITFCFEHGIPTILNPAPARSLSKDVIDKVSYLTPNEHEFKVLFPDKELSDVLAEYPNKLIITMGATGALVNNGQKEVLVPAFKTTPVDTTGAGDTFNGALAAGILNGLSLEASITYANLAASMSVKKLGAQGGMPKLEQMKASEFFEKAWHVE
ncbi:ribokinase [Candidatus Enterococcus clewellii]|uniref:Ribokinase n=1 Tax=Candidatus Enterococcus clewellii TaxID=1834193 RepID=A0A242K963_9ENTE|nr:ribokinase [Enterococcus sp. 9E7_DIV0242]OTP17703.1 ribokinase [Enterococcus sp. 9E7_DIV0242]